MTRQPQAVRRGWLKNGNPPGDLAKAKPCGARTRSGKPCRGPAMKNGRCRMHGGPSPGAPKGNQNAYKHGRYSAQSILRRRQIAALICEMRDTAADSAAAR